MAAIVASTRWFPASYFGTVVGIILGLSQLGNLSATLPMAMASSMFGWRQSYLAVTILTATLALASALLVRDAPPGHPFHSRKYESFASAWRGVIEVLSVRDLWPLLVIAAAAFAMVSCLLGLWGGSYLYDVYGLDTTARGQIIFCLVAGMVVGNFTLAPLERILQTRKKIIVACGLASTAVFAAMAAEPAMPLWGTTAAFVMIGLFSGYTIVIIAHGRCFYPDRLMGRGVTVVNTAVLAGAGLMQALTGTIAGTLAPGATSLNPDIYRIIFATLAALLLIALFIYRRCPDVAPGAYEEKHKEPTHQETS
jgi:hypothetical protein